MTRLSILAASVLLAAAAAQPVIVSRAPSGRSAYLAVGRNPSWMLGIDERGISLRLARNGRVDFTGSEELIFPPAASRTEGDARFWRSGEGERAITVEARPGTVPCFVGGPGASDIVTVRLHDRALSGCGGWLFGEGPR